MLDGLNNPHFVCTDATHVYVTDYKRNGVFVFTKTGDFVKLFGSKGSEDGQFDHPYGIALDPDGFLYVSDKVNNRVQVF